MIISGSGFYSVQSKIRQIYELILRASTLFRTFFLMVQFGKVPEWVLVKKKLITV
jgi:hypothetical protein